ncbi:MAG: ergothioneine biosynthesis protein EgtB [Acidobacteriota bacterium]|nr:ergothioneine biosynthesis protein EgtB [Acidobacteriota bacterium]
MPTAIMTKTQAGTAAALMAELFKQVREQTMRIVAPLEVEDYVIQTAEFMSPPRWHIGHTSWFFETLMQAHQADCQIYDEDFLFYFNSYYEGFGKRIQRARRGTRSRPTVKETVRYRQHIDSAMLKFLEQVGEWDDPAALLQLVRLGLEHEMQHQELLVYDIKHLLCDLYDAPPSIAPVAAEEVSGMAEIEGGLFELGYSGDGFAWDNEKPQHKVFLQDFAIDYVPVSVGEYLEFINSGAYQDYRWWLSAGWDAVNNEQWQAPLYWEQHDGDQREWMIRDFHGLHPARAKASEPITHISYFEAAAFAKWAGKRLPTEAEWEKAACFDPHAKIKHNFPWGDAAPEAHHANLFENQLWNVAPIGTYPKGKSFYGCHQMIGGAWEWTTSDYAPYPGFKTDFNEYNDKWFVGQKVLRGGSFATPRIHIRTTYRNFFHPHERWMVSGFRCAKTL